MLRLCCPPGLWLTHGLPLCVHACRRLINESEEIAEQREGIKKRLTLLQRAAKEIAAFM